MNPRSVGDATIRETPLLRSNQDVGSAVEEIVRSGLPALPVVGAGGRLEGIFGEREFIGALFPGYVGQLSSARFIPEIVDRELRRRSQCRNDPVSRYMTTEHVQVGPDYSDVQLAETFLHHRVLILPVVADGRVVGVITRSDFFRRLVERFGSVR